MNLDNLLDMESIVSLCIAGQFLAVLLILLHPGIGGNSLKRYLMIVAASSCLFFVVSAGSLLVGDVLARPDLVYWLILARLIVRCFLPISFFLLAYKTVRSRHDQG